MIPRSLPSLTADAVRNGWEISLQHRYGPSVAVRLDRGGDIVRLEWWWKNGKLALSIAEINNSPTNYAQCARYVRSPEGATP